MAERLRLVALPAAAIVAALVIHLPAVTSGFVMDDYVYLRAAQTMSFGEYARVVFTPHIDNELLYFGEHFYRPLYFLSFWPLERLFGDHAWAYHLVLLTIHCASIVLTTALALRLTRSWLAAGLASLVFVLHPLPYEAVTWVSSLNSIALPLGLGALLLYLRAVEADAPRRRWTLHALAAGLALLALGFRETSVAFLVAIGLWHVAFAAPIWQRESWPKQRELLPYFGTGFVYVLLRTAAFTRPLASPEQVTAGREQFFSQVVDVVQMAWVPVAEAQETWAQWAVRVAPVLFVAVVLFALVTNRRVVLYCLAVFLVCGAAFATSPLFVAPRYLYFSLPFFAIALGALGADAFTFAATRLPRTLLVAGTAVVGVLFCGVLLVEQQRRVDAWTREFPDVHEAWVSELRAAYDDVPSDTLCVSGTPFILRLFDDFALTPTVNYYYPEVTRVVVYEPGEPPAECSARPAFDYAPVPRARMLE